MSDHSHKLLSAAAVALMAIGIVAVIAVNEYRLRDYVLVPQWPQEKDDVVNRLDKIDDRLQRFEQRVILILKDEQLQGIERQ